jgi:hypothetical protein
MRLLLKYCILTLDSCLSFADFNVSNHGLPAPALHRTRRVALWGRPARVPTATVESAAGWAGLGSMRQCCNRMSGPSGEVFGEQIVQDVGWLIMSVNFGELAINPSSWIPMPRCYAGPVRLVRKFLLPPKHGKVSEICKASRNFKVQSWKLRDSELPKVPSTKTIQNHKLHNLDHMLLPCDLLSSRPLHQDQIVPVTTQSERPVPGMPMSKSAKTNRCSLAHNGWSPICGLAHSWALLWVLSSLCKMSKTKRCKTSVDGGKATKRRSAYSDDSDDSDDSDPSSVRNLQRP